MPTRPTTYVATDAAAVGGAAHTLTVETLGAGRYAVTLGGVRRELEALALPEGGMSLLLDGDSHSIELEAKGERIAVRVGGQLTTLDVVEERRLRMRQAGKALVAQGRQVIASPMPGKIVKVFVKVGDAVVQGQGLVVVEAMKMENELKAARAGTVVEVSAVEGATVENGARLLVVE